MLTRRELIVSAASAATVSALPTQREPRRFRIVHMTDIHMRSGNGAPEGIALTMQKVRALRPRPDFVITGGDTFEGLMASDWERARQHAKNLDEMFRSLEMPVHHCIGNHDVIGWSRRHSASANDEPLYGKAMFAERMVKGPLVRSFDHRGWHFVFLDAIQFDFRSPRKYDVSIDDAQMDWLKADLERTGTRTPIVITTHAPLMSSFHLISDGADNRDYVSMVLRNGKAVNELLKGYNVKLVLQGHTHILESVRYAGRLHLTSGAVCGSWWQGKRFGIDPEGFSVIDLSPDTVLNWRYEPSGWVARS